MFYCCGCTHYNFKILFIIMLSIYTHIRQCFLEDGSLDPVKFMMYNTHKMKEEHKFVDWILDAILEVASDEQKESNDIKKARSPRSVKAHGFLVMNPEG